MNTLYNGVDGFVKDLGCTVRECVECGCLVPGGPTRCKRCAIDSKVGDAQSRAMRVQADIEDVQRLALNDPWVRAVMKTTATREQKLCSVIVLICEKLKKLECSRVELALEVGPSDVTGVSDV